jgi:hypothetical protein
LMTSYIYPSEIVNKHPWDEAQDMIEDRKTFRIIPKT